MKRFKQLAVLGAALVALGMSPGAPASASERSITFNTALAPQYYGGGEYDGILHLSFADDGSVSGYYHDADSGVVRTVVGGVEKDHIWLDLGERGLLLIDGTYDGKTISGYTYLAGENYSFKATPQR